MNLTLPWTSSKPANKWTAPIEDVKSQISEHVDHLAQMAAQLGREVSHGTQDAGSQAADVAKDIGSQAADIGSQAIKATQSAGGQAVAVAREIPTGAASLAQQALKGLSQLGRDVRSVRVTREPPPPPRGPDVMPGIALLGGFAGGLALMFFLDPEQGRRRRALLRDQITKWTRIGREAATGKAKDVRNRTIGAVHETRKAVTGLAGEQSEAETETSEYATIPVGNGHAPEEDADRQNTERMTSEVG